MDFVLEDSQRGPKLRSSGLGFEGHVERPKKCNQVGKFRNRSRAGAATIQILLKCLNHFKRLPCRNRQFRRTWRWRKKKAGQGFRTGSQFDEDSVPTLPSLLLGTSRENFQPNRSFPSTFWLFWTFKFFILGLGFVYPKFLISDSGVLHLVL